MVEVDVVPRDGIELINFYDEHDFEVTDEMVEEIARLMGADVEELEDAMIFTRKEFVDYIYDEMERITKKCPEARQFLMHFDLVGYVYDLLLSGDLSVFSVEVNGVRDYIFVLY